MKKPDVDVLLKPEPEATITAVPDMFDLEVRLEEFYGEEIRKLEAKLSDERGAGSKLRATCMSLIARVDPTMATPDMDTILENTAVLDALEELKKRVDRGVHLQQLIDAIEANELLKPQWKRLMVSLRMVE
jgi:hypothetical protein